MITTSFNNNTLEVYKDNRLIIVQPFKPTSTGDQINWLNEEEAIAWWDTEKHRYDYDLPEVEPPPLGELPAHLTNSGQPE